MDLLRSPRKNFDLPPFFPWLLSEYPYIQSNSPKTLVTLIMFLPWVVIFVPSFVRSNLMINIIIGAPLCGADPSFLLWQLMKTVGLTSSSPSSLGFNSLLLSPVKPRRARSDYHSEWRLLFFFSFYSTRHWPSLDLPPMDPSLSFYWSEQPT